MKFRCVKPTEFKGRQVTEGQVIDIDAKKAKTLDKHPCWAKIEPAKDDK